MAAGSNGDPQAPLSVDFLQILSKLSLSVSRARRRHRQVEVSDTTNGTQGKGTARA